MEPFSCRPARCAGSLASGHPAGSGRGTGGSLRREVPSPHRLVPLGNGPYNAAAGDPKELRTPPCPCAPELFRKGRGCADGSAGFAGREVSQHRGPGWDACSAGQGSQPLSSPGVLTTRGWAGGHGGGALLRHPHSLRRHRKPVRWSERCLGRVMTLSAWARTPLSAVGTGDLSFPCVDRSPRIRVREVMSAF